MIDDSQQKAAQEESLPPDKAAQEGTPPSDTSDAISGEMAEQAATEESPTYEPEVKEPPLQNQYAELKRKLDKTIQQNEWLMSQLQNNQTQQVAATPQPKTSFQPTQADFGEIIVKELQQKVASGEIDGNNYYDVIRFQARRTQELVAESTMKQTKVQTERQVSESRAIKKAKDLGYDITNRQDPMGALAWQEVGRRASTLGMTAQEYYNVFPYAFEDAINAVSGTLPTKQQQQLQMKQATLPISDINTARRKPVEKEPEPTELDNALSRRYGSDFKTVSRIQKTVQDPKNFEVTIPIDMD